MINLLVKLKLYHEDFERERHARMAAIKVKNLAEERMKKMERDMKELRDKIKVHNMYDKYSEIDLLQQLNCVKDL